MIKAAQLKRELAGGGLPISFPIHGAPGAAITLRAVRGLGAPIPRRDAELRAAAHGELDRTKYYGARVIELEGQIRGASIDALHDTLEEFKGFVAPGVGELSLELTYGDNMGGATSNFRRAIVQPAGALEVEFAGVRNRIKWALVLSAPDPRLYDAEESAVFVVTNVGGGLAFPLEFPLVFAPGASSTLAVANDGTTPTPVKLEITGPAINPGVRNEHTGEELITAGLELGTSGELLVLDTAKRTALLNGVARPDVIDAAASSWFTIAPDVGVQLRLLGTGFQSGVTSFTAKWSDAYL